MAHPNVDHGGLDQLTVRAIEASKAGDSRESLTLLVASIASGNASAITHFLLASELASLQDYCRAEAAFATAVLMAPEWPIARYQLGLLQLSSGRAGAALVTWGPLFQLDSSDPLGHFVRGFAALAEDDFAQATSEFRAGLALPNDNAALVSDIEKVLERIKAALDRNGDADKEEPTASHVLVSNYGRMGNLH